MVIERIPIEERERMGRAKDTKRRVTVFTVKKAVKRGIQVFFFSVKGGQQRKRKKNEKKK